MQTRSRRTRITNATEWSKPFLSRMLRWVKKQVGCTKMPKAHFGNRSLVSFRGYCCYSGSITVRIGPSALFPLDYQYPGRKSAPAYTLGDRIDALLSLTIHETIHARDFQRGIFACSEIDVERRHFRYLTMFREQRETLLSQWNEPVKERPKAPAKSRSEKTLERNQKALSRWEAKMKLARTKVAKYRAAVRAGERYAAAKAAKGS